MNSDSMAPCNTPSSKISGFTPPSTPVQRPLAELSSSASSPCQPSLSPPSTPPPSSPLSSCCSVSAEEGDKFPLTPESKRSRPGGVYRTGTIAVAGSPPPSLKSSHKPCSHPYPRPASFEDDDIFNRMLGHPSNSNVEEMNQMATDVFLQGLNGLSHESLCLAIRYKEAVYQRKRSRVEMTRRELDETSKLHTLLHSISRDNDLECAMAEKERNFFLGMLVDRQPTLPNPTTNMRYSRTAHARDMKALSLADAELGLLQRNVKESNRPFSLSIERLPAQEHVPSWD